MLKGNLQTDLETDRIKTLDAAPFSGDDAGVQPELPAGRRAQAGVDILLVNPPAPDGIFWCNSRPWFNRSMAAKMTWSQVSLAQIAALLAPDYKVMIVDAVAEGLNWAALATILRQKQPRYYLTWIKPASGESDMFGAFLARGQGATTIAFGPTATAIAPDIMDLYPNLDFIVRGEPELTLRELIDTLEVAAGRRPAARTESGSRARLEKMFTAVDPAWQPVWRERGALDDNLKQVPGLTWRHQGQIVTNRDRPLLPDLDMLPLPYHHLLPLNHYRLSLFKGAYAALVTNRSYPAGYHEDGQQAGSQVPVRLRSPEHIMAELWLLYDLGIHNVHLVGDAFTLNREQMLGVCRMIIEEEMPLRWICNSNVADVDEEVLTWMHRAGCFLITWNLDTVPDPSAQKTGSIFRFDQVRQMLGRVKRAGIQSRGLFTIGRPGETEESIKETISLAKKLPLDLAFFHPAMHRPGQPLYAATTATPGLRPAGNGGAVDVDGSPGAEQRELSTAELEYWQKRAFREWALGRNPIWGMLTGWQTLARFKSSTDVGWQSLG